MSDVASDQPAVWTKLQEIFREVFEMDALEIAPLMTAEDLEEWDSLSHMELMVEIERSFDIRFNTNELMNLANVGDMAALIARRQGQGAA